MKQGNNSTADKKHDSNYKQKLIYELKITQKHNLILVNSLKQIILNWGLIHLNQHLH